VNANKLCYPDLEDCHTSLFKDGVHLSFLGNDIFINIIQGALEQFLLNPYTNLYHHTYQGQDVCQ
jgi:lysophospholipase L1-like esterase